MEEKFTIAAVGDIFMGFRVEDTINDKGKDYIFELVRSFIHRSELAICNLENVISNIELLDKNKDQLIAKPPSLDALKNAGFNAVSIANNHIMDFGITGLQDTINALEERAIGYAGAGLNEASARQPLRITGNKNVTLLAYYGTATSALGNGGGTNGGEVSKVLKDIRNARSETDIVLVAIHWGRYAKKLPMKHQIDFAHQMIDCGAKVVLGSGPHTLQPVELYNGGVIAYSLGNFVFDYTVFDPPNPDVRQSMILHITFANDRVENVTIIPILISDEDRPEPIDCGTYPTLFKDIQSLLFRQLNTFESDSCTAIEILSRRQSPIIILKKIFRRDQRAYPLSFYLRSLIELIKEKLNDS